MYYLFLKNTLIKLIDFYVNHFLKMRLIIIWTKVSALSGRNMMKMIVMQQNPTISLAICRL